MKPTMKLRWGFGSGEDVPTVTMWCYEVDSDYRLQQWWEDDAGNGEWRDVPKES